MVLGKGDLSCRWNGFLQCKAIVPVPVACALERVCGDFDELGFHEIMPASATLEDPVSNYWGLKFRHKSADLYQV